MTPAYYIIRDYYLPRRTGTIADDLCWLSWLVIIYSTRARINLIYRGSKIFVHEGNLQADAYIDLQADAYIDLQADAYRD